MTRTIRSAILLTLLTTGLLSAQAFANPATVSIPSGWVRETPPGARNGVAFLTLANTGDHVRAIVDVQCRAVAARCEVHEHVHSNGNMRMQKVVAPLGIPAGGTLQFVPGGYHIMLLDLTAPLLAGAMVELVFVLDDQSTVTASLPVKPVSRE